MKIIAIAVLYYLISPADKAIVQHGKNGEEAEWMTEKDLYLLYILQIEEVASICQGMGQKDYEDWKRKTLGDVPKEDVGTMEKIIIIIDMCLGR